MHRSQDVPQARLENVELREAAASESPRNALGLDARQTADGVARLVLTLMKALHELLERQAIRRMEGGELTDPQVEKLGAALMRQAEEIERLRKEFGLSDEDLNLDLGPLGRLR